MFLIHKNSAEFKCWDLKEGLTAAVNLTESFLWQQGPVLHQEVDVRFLRAQLVVPDVPITLKHTNETHQLLNVCSV